MPRSGNDSSMIKRWLDGLVGFISGERPVKALSGPRAWRLTAWVGAVALVTSGWLIWHSISVLGRPPASANVNSPTAVAALEKLKTKDTDGDGLSDYDELISYKTSPYLKDSDSDGVDDKAEVLAGTNANCPSGKICGALANGGTVDQSGQLSPAFLRQALRASGVPQTTIDKLTDEQIVSVYQQATAHTGSTNGNTNTSLSAPTLQSLQSLDAAEIRQLLIDSGIDEQTLSQVDDATLKQVFQQALNSESQP